MGYKRIYVILTTNYIFTNTSRSSVDFSHNLEHFSDTIVARATALGSAGVAIIRLSGPKALAIANHMMNKNLTEAENRKAYFTSFIDEQGLFIDEGIALMMKNPHSFTGEDVVELQCHGGPFIVEKIIATATHFGARIADPGEFTKRAFLNGKIDLTKAEAIGDMIAAKSEASHQAATKQLCGALETTITHLMDNLIDMAAHFEVAVDYPEEDLELESKANMERILKEKIESISALLATFESGQKAKTGTSVCLIGKPNVGKSSLMNALLKTNRCIVTPVPGTTRDFIEEDFFIQGTHFHLKDTAGIRTTDSIIEREGIKASLEAIDETDIILLVLDASTTEELPSISKNLPKDKTILIWNKTDLQKPLISCATDFPHTLHVSAKKGVGMSDIENCLLTLASSSEKQDKDALLLTNVRHKKLLEEAQTDLTRVLEGLGSGLSVELLAFDMKSALNHLSGIIGRNISEDILSSVFDNFCVGK